MMEKTVKMSAIAGGIDALGRLSGVRMSTWKKTREFARFYGAVVEEVNAYNAELESLENEYPDGGVELERRVNALISGEVSLPELTLTEADFADASDLPTPADMYLLGKIINFDEGGQNDDES